MKTSETSSSYNFLKNNLFLLCNMFLESLKKILDHRNIKSLKIES
jgi:hypothetical protein